MRTVRGHMVFSRSCPGMRRQRPAAAASVRRLRRHRPRHAAEAVQVRIPAGVADGDRVRVPGKGNAGLRGGEPGDLYITVQVAAHPLFRREGDDVHMVGADCDSRSRARRPRRRPDAGRRRRLRVPPGTQSGQRFRLRERGAPSTRDGRRGDLVVEVKLVLPRVLDERSKELLREFGRINGENVRESFGETGHGDGDRSKPHDLRASGSVARGRRWRSVPAARRIT